EPGRFAVKAGSKPGREKTKLVAVSQRRSTRPMAAQSLRQPLAAQGLVPSALLHWPRQSAPPLQVGADSMGSASQRPPQLPSPRPLHRPVQVPLHGPSQLSAVASSQVPSQRP